MEKMNAGAESQEEISKRQPQTPRGSILAGTIWMVVLSALLFWLPALGPLIAGYVGGKKSGGVIKGLIAGIIPAILIGVLLLTVGSSLSVPLIGLLLGGAATVFVLLHSGILLVGAIIGGALA